MKVSKLFLGLFGLLAFASCGEEKDMPENPGGVVDGDTRFMSVTIRNAQGSRAGEGEGEQNPGDIENSIYENGLTPENDIKSLRFYFFDGNGNAAAVKSNGKNYYDCTEITPEGADIPNVEKKLKAVIVINTEKGDNIYNLKKMVAVANMPGISDNDPSKNLAELRADIRNFNVDGDEFKAYENGTAKNLKPFVMTSSVFGSNDFQCEVEIKPGDIYTTLGEAETNPVDVFIERVVAKVRVSFAWENTMTKIPVTLDGKSFEAIKLTEKPAEGATTGEDIKTADGQKNIYVIFTGWNPTGVAKTSYAFKKVDSAWNLGWDWADKAFYRSYWAENAFADAVAGTVAGTDAAPLLYFSKNAAVGKFGSAVVNGSSKDFDGSFYYIQENAASKDNNGLKKAFNPSSELSNRSQVYLGAILVTVEDGVATPLTLAEWGGSKYTADGLKAKMLEVVSSQIFFGKKNTTTTTEPGGDTVETTTWEYQSLGMEHVELVSAIDIKNGLFDAEGDARYMTYIQLVDESDEFWPVGFEHKFYSRMNPNGPAAEDEMTRDQVNLALTKMPGAMVWESGQTYYYTDLQHLAFAKDGSFDTKGAYGVVRNHIYDVELNTVYGLGTPIFDPTTGDGENTIIIPQKPDPEYAYIGARINVLSWRVVRQGVSLDW